MGGETFPPTDVPERSRGVVRAESPSNSLGDIGVLCLESLPMQTQIMSCYNQIQSQLYISSYTANGLNSE
jgi:hypothetical protein